MTPLSPTDMQIVAKKSFFLVAQALLVKIGAQ
jgi:hypothetical protein